MDFSVILFPLKLTRIRIYPGPAAQGLIRLSVLVYYQQNEGDPERLFVSEKHWITK